MPAPPRLCARRVGKLDFNHSGWGIPRFIDHTELSPKSVDGKLIFEVSQQATEAS